MARPPGGLQRVGGWVSASSARGPRAPAVALAPARATVGSRRVQWLAMLLLLLLLLLGAPLGSTEGAGAKLTPELVLEWQGEYAPGRRDQMGTSGAAVVKGKERERRWGRARAAGFRWWPHFCTPEKALWMGQPCTQIGPAPLSLSSAPPPSALHPPGFYSRREEGRGLGLQAPRLNSGHAQDGHRRLGDVSKCKLLRVAYLGGLSLSDK